MADGSLVLAIDVGSSAVRAAIVDASGRIVASHRVGRPDSASGLVFDPGLLWEQVVHAVASLPTAPRAAARGISIAGHIGTVFTDSEFGPVGPGRGWADTSGVSLLAGRYSELGIDPLEEIGRATLTGGAAAASLALLTDDREAFGSVRHILSPKDYLVARLTGIAATDFTTAAYTGLSSVRDRDWSPRLLQAVGIDTELLPRQLSSTDVVAGLARREAGLLGLPADIPIVGGGPDGTVGATFVLGDRHDVIADVAGTTDVLVQPIDEPGMAPVGATINPYPLGGWAAGGPTGMTGGALSRWAELLGRNSVAEAMDELGPAMARIGPGSGGLSVRPTLSGSRFPRWNPAEVGLVVGQTDSHGAEHFMRAAAEGAAFVVREGVDLLAAGSRAKVVLAGGAARSRVLAQMRADVLDRDVLVCLEPDVSLMGAALLAMLGSGIHSSVTSAAAALDEQTTRVTPDRDAADRYRQLYAAWLEETGASRQP